MGFNLVGELRKRGGGDEGELVMEVELGWRHGDVWGRCSRAYIGAWEESERIKNRIGDKI
jgi:hypothetical protein